MSRHMSLAVVGADHPNASGPARRFEIALCLPGERVTLTPEPRNPVDPRAIAVFSARSIKIGYIRAERASLVLSWLTKGRALAAVFQCAAPWGATIRIALDGEEPALPDARETEEAEREDGFWPDYMPPDD